MAFGAGDRLESDVCLLRLLLITLALPQADLENAAGDTKKISDIMRKLDDAINATAKNLGENISEVTKDAFPVVFDCKMRKLRACVLSNENCEINLHESNFVAHEEYAIKMG